MNFNLPKKKGFIQAPFSPSNNNSTDNKKNGAGFTLIELLVVIAVIGILASIVLASLQGARNKAKDSRIISEIDQIKNWAEMQYTEDGNYNDVDCTAGSPESCNDCVEEIKRLCEDISGSKAGGALTIQAGTDSNGDYAYCAYSPLNAPRNNQDAWYCISSYAESAIVTDNPNGTCNSSGFHCP